MRKKNKNFIERYLKIAHQIKKSLSEIININFINLNKKLITITYVQIKPGNTHAKIFFTFIENDNKNIKNILNILQNNSNFFKKKLSERLSIYSIPNLQFIHDKISYKTNRILNLIKLANNKNINKILKE